MSITLFRMMIVVYILTIASGYLIPALTEPTDLETKSLFLQDGLGAIVETNISLFFVLLALNVLIPIGLYRFTTLARPAFLLYTAATLGLILLWGYRVTSPTIAAIGFVSALLQGAILCSAYSSPIRERFAKKQA